MDGFLVADGYFNFRANRIELSLSIKDKQQLEAFMSYCETIHQDSRNFDCVIHTNKVITKTTTLRTYTVGTKELFNKLITNRAP